MSDFLHQAEIKSLNSAKRRSNLIPDVENGFWQNIHRDKQDNGKTMGVIKNEISWTLEYTFLWSARVHKIMVLQILFTSFQLDI